MYQLTKNPLPSTGSHSSNINIDPPLNPFNTSTSGAMGKLNTDITGLPEVDTYKPPIGKAVDTSGLQVNTSAMGANTDIVTPTTATTATSSKPLIEQDYVITAIISFVFGTMAFFSDKKYLYVPALIFAGMTYYKFPKK